MGLSAERHGGCTDCVQGTAGATIISPNNKTPDGIDLEGTNRIVIDGFTIDNEEGTITRAGIRVCNNSNVVIQNNTTTKNRTWGIYTRTIRSCRERAHSRR